MNRMTPQQRVSAAIKRMEERAMSMLRKAEIYGKNNGEFGLTSSRRDLLEAARLYAGSVDAVTRCRSSNAKRKVAKV
jgi:hypothetical protein